MNRIILVGTILIQTHSSAIQATQGQMIALASKQPMSEVSITGTNQYGHQTQWQHSTRGTLALSANWWWQGRATITFKLDVQYQKCTLEGLGMGPAVVLVEVQPNGTCRGDAHNRTFKYWNDALEQYIQSRKTWWTLFSAQQAVSQLTQEAEQLNRTSDGYSALLRLLSLQEP